MPNELVPVIGLLVMLFAYCIVRLGIELYRDMYDEGDDNTFGGELDSIDDHGQSCVPSNESSRKSDSGFH